MAKHRLAYLMDRKEKLYCKYFPITPTLKEDIVDGGTDISKDKMADYVHELHEIDIGTGMSLAEEIRHQQANINRLQSYINDMNETLSKMTGIEYELYYEIVVKGTNISRAVSIIAEKYEKDDRTIWKYHYSQIKRDVKRVIYHTKN
jgi:hypothetical protein